MKNIYTSATKLVFLLTAITVCSGFFLGMISEQAFLQVATAVFSFYYGTKALDKPRDESQNLG